MPSRDLAEATVHTTVLGARKGISLWEWESSEGQSPEFSPSSHIPPTFSGPV